MAILFASPSAAADWPHWRGPLRNGVSSESSGWRDAGDWPGQPIWQTETGEGGSSPLVVDNQVFVIGWRDGHDNVQCLELATGKPKWRHQYEAAKFGRHAVGDQGLYSGPTSTPEYDAETGFLFTLSADGSLRCWDTGKQGQPVWTVELYESFAIDRRPKVGRSGQRDYGYTTSPLVWKDWLIVEVGAQEGSLIAFDKRTGRQVWKSEASQPAGHTGGLVPIQVEGTPCVAVHTFEGLLVVRLDPDKVGQTVGTYPWKTEFANSIATPATDGTDLLITSEYNQNRIARLHVSLEKGVSVVWEKELASKICSPVIKDGFVYWTWQQLHCLRWEDGSQIWEGGRLGDAGSLVATADHRLILWVDNGRLLLVDDAQRSPDKYRPITETRPLGRSDAWPHVVLAEQRLLCKDRTGLLIAFELESSPGPGN